MEKKDFYYILSFMGFIIIGIFTFHYGTDEDDIVSYIGFAGTLVSIILAVSALIFAFYQNSVYGKKKKKLDTSAKKIENVTNALDQTKELISNQLKDSISDLKASLNRSILQVNESYEKISASLEEHSFQNSYIMDAMQQVHENLIEKRYNSPLTEQADIDSENLPDEGDFEIFLKNYVIFLTINQTAMIYYLIRILHSGKMGNILELLFWTIEYKFALNAETYAEGDEREKLGVLSQNLGMFWSMYHLLSPSNAIELSGTLTATKVTSVNTFLKNEIINKFENSEQVTPETLESLNTLVNRLPQQD